MKLSARRPAVAGFTLALVLSGGLLSGCSSDATTTTPAGASSASAGATGAPAAAAALTLTDGWVKAADTGMTALFGTLKNTGSAPVTVVGGSSDIAGMIETHEVVMVDGAAKMQPKKGGFEIPPGGTHTLAPGHDHIMLMGLTKAVKPGDQVKITLKLGDGSTVDVTGLGKDFSAGNESYQPSGGASPSASKSGM